MTKAVCAGLAALLVLFAFTARASATTFTLHTAFGASGLANPLDGPSFDAIDPYNRFIYVANYRYGVTNTVERFNYDGTPAPFTSGDVTSNVLGLADSNGDAAVFRGASPSTFNCNTQEPNTGSSYNPAGIRCFDEPRGLAVDPQGNLYVANSAVPTVDIFSKTGGWIGEIGPYFDSTHQNGWGGLPDYLGDPSGVAYDTANNLLFIANLDGDILVFHGNGAAIPTFNYVGKLGSSLGSAVNQFYYPEGLATDNNGNLWIADSGNARVDHWTYSFFANMLTVTPASTNPNWYAGSSFSPQGVAYTPGDGNQTPPSVFVTDQYGYDVDQFSPTGSLIGSFGSYGGAAGQFENPVGIAALANDGLHGTNLFVVDAGEDQVDDFIAPTPPSNTAAPSISGTAQVGQMLTASTGTWSGVSSASSYSYDWQQCDSGGSNCASIQKSSSNTLLLGAGNAGHTVRVGVTANNGQNSSEVVSAPTAVVTSAAPAAAAPTLPGKSNTKVSSAPATATTAVALSPAGQVIKLKTVSGAEVTLELVLDKKTAKAADLGTGKHAVVVGTVTVGQVKGTAATVKAVLSRRARRALGKLHRTFRLTLRITFSLAGHAYTIVRVETIHQPRHRKKKK